MQLEPGDLLFQDLDAGPLCEAIERVTHGYAGAHFTHVGIVVAPPRVKEHDAPGEAEECGEVLEAVSAGVKLTPLPEFLARSKDAQGKPKVVAGRLRAPYRKVIPSALAYGDSLVGRPYDGVFEIGNHDYYCSELVYEIFSRANGGSSIFALHPMTFKDPDTRETFPAWAEYFRERGVPVPEGRPGINPGGISRSPAIEIVRVYGVPDGWNTARTGVSPIR